MDRREFVRSSGLLLMGAAASGRSHLASGQDAWPARPIRLIVPLAVGGSSDIYARVFAKYMSERIRQPWVVENRPGASGALAAAAAARAPADGHNLFFANSTILAILPGMMEKPTYDVERDFAQISLVGTIPLLLAVHPSVPATNLQQVVDLLKANPGKYSFGTAGLGTPPHLAGELFQKLTGTRMLHVPYQGSAPADTDAIAGINLIHVAGFATALSLHKAGKLRMIAVMDTRRASVAPDLPTTAEAGYPDLLAGSFFVLCAPAGTPRPILSALYEATQQVVGSAGFRSQAAELSVDPVSGYTPERTLEFVRREREQKWLPIVKSTGAKLS